MPASKALVVEESLFDDVADILRGMAPVELGEVRHRAHRYGTIDGQRTKLTTGPAAYSDHATVG